MDDLFLLRLSGDDVSAGALAGELDAIGVSHRMDAILAGNAVPQTPYRLIELLRQARFGAFLVTRRLPLILWPELDLTTLKLIIDRVVFICDRVPVAALRRVSPAYEQFETIESEGKWNLVASHLASILKADPGSYFATTHSRLRTLPTRPSAVTTSSIVSTRQETPKGPSLPSGGQMRIFVSSTFRDMHAERDLLGRFVFPQLRDHCRASGVEVVEVDLRWGVTDEEIEHGELLKRCLDEIDHASRYFVVILGDRYGTAVGQIDEQWQERWPFLSGAAGTSIFDIEVTHGALRPGTQPLFFARLPTYGLVAPPSERSAFIEDENGRERLENLKTRIRAAGHTLTEYVTPEEFAWLALAQLKQVINSDLPRNRGRNELEPKPHEQEDFLEDVTRHTIEREGYHRQIDACVCSSHSPLLLTGPSGIGKTVLLAQWLRWRVRTHAEDILIFLSAQASVASTVDWFTLTSVIEDLHEHLGLADFRPEGTEIDLQIDEMVSEWQRRSCRSDRPIILIDSPDRLRYGFSGRHSALSPLDFGSSCQIVCAIDDLDCIVVDDYQELKVEGLAPYERLALATSFLSRYGKRLPEDALSLIESAPQTATPRFLTTLLSELRLYGDHTRVLDRLRWYLKCETLIDLFDRVLGRMEENYDIDRPGLVKDAMSFIWASANGISEEHLLSLLGTSGPLAPELWAPFRISLADSLRATITGLEFSHAAIREAVRRRYVPNQGDAITYHRRLVLSLVAGDGAQFNDRRANILEHLDAGQSWLQLAYFLGQEDYFLDLWGRSEESKDDVIKYWKHIEESSSVKMRAEYSNVIEHPETARPELLVAVVELLAKRGATDLVRDIVRRLANSAHGESAADSEVVIPSRYARVLIATEEWTEASVQLSRERDDCELVGNRAAVARILREQAQVSNRQGCHEEALESYREAEAICRTLALGDELVANLWGQRHTLQLLGRLAEARHVSNEAAEIRLYLDGARGSEAR
jgi:Domain of unknown function (DUF4062)